MFSDYFTISIWNSIVSSAGQEDGASDLCSRRPLRAYVVLKTMCSASKIPWVRMDYRLRDASRVFAQFSFFEQFSREFTWFSRPHYLAHCCSVVELRRFAIHRLDSSERSRQGLLTFKTDRILCLCSHVLGVDGVWPHH